MLKRIRVQQVCVGMYVHEFCGSWIQHPFWSRQLLIADQATLDTLRASSITEVIIDLTQGVDLGLSMVVDSESEPPVFVRLDVPEARPLTVVQESPLRYSLQDELVRARELVARGKQDVIRMFADVRLGRAIESEGLKDLISDMSASLLRHPHAFLTLARIKTRDEYTYMHSLAVAALMLAMARHHGFDEDFIKLAGFAGLLHDAGKTAMPESILNKPGTLTSEEYAIMRRHPTEGERLLRSMGMLPEVVLDVCLHHHEKFDGSGYPAGQSGEGISLFGRMGAICDVYDAVTSNRPYRAGWDPATALHRMAGWQGHFDPALFAEFVQMMGIYPTGSLVRLKSERLAVVLEQTQGSLLKPQLRIFYSLSLRQRIVPELLDLAAPDTQDSIVGREDPQKWPFTDLEQLWMQHE